MSTVVILSGTLTVGPPLACDGFPSLISTVELGLGCGSCGKPANVATATPKRSIASPSAFVTLTGIGAADTVTKANFLFFKSDATLLLRLTVGDGLGGTTVLDPTPVSGLFIQEFPSGQELQLLEAKGTATIEYLATGAS